tara:strand:+ start:385 stop:1080 length:696 start_codon:yes stop_codon:yes gene_type:complete
MVSVTHSAVITSAVLGSTKLRSQPECVRIAKPQKKTIHDILREMDNYEYKFLDQEQRAALQEWFGDSVIQRIDLMIDHEGFLVKRRGDSDRDSEDRNAGKVSREVGVNTDIRKIAEVQKLLSKIEKILPTLRQATLDQIEMSAEHFITASDAELYRSGFDEVIHILKIKHPKYQVSTSKHLTQIWFDENRGFNMNPEDDFFTFVGICFGIDGPSAFKSYKEHKSAIDGLVQ